MMAAFVDAALRSLLLAAAVWAAFCVFRVRNVIALKRAWASVLVCALLMPAVLPFAARWRVFPAASFVVPAALKRVASVIEPATLQAAPQAPALVLPRFDDSPRAPRNSARLRDASPGNSNQRSALLQSAVTAPSPAASRRPTPSRNPISISVLATWLYFAVATALLFRLLVGLASTLRLWLAAKPVKLAAASNFAHGVRLRSSGQVASPVTIGSGVLLPDEYQLWDDEKLRIVLAHERVHIRELDFYLQILASVYAAIAWFSPLGWWLKRKLSDLGETVSDHSGLLEAACHTTYAQILLDFAAAPRPTLIGVAMARQSSISRRIERLLNDSAFRRAFVGGRRVRIAVMLVPVAIFTVTTLVRVQAASESSWKTGVAYLQSAATADPQPAPPAPQAPPAAPGAPSAKVMPATGVALEYPGASGAPATPASPASADSPASPAAPDAPALAQNESAPAAPAPESTSQETFDRTLSFSGNLALSVLTGAGNITLTKGAAGQVHIHGIVKAGRNADPAQVQQIVANPPIEQNGNVIRVGGQHGENLHNISISYEIEAPADTTLIAETGSGNITDTGVGQNAKLQTGSGNINATGIEGGFKTQTGSGNIEIEGTGQGDAKAQTGSGNIDLKGVAGALEAQTGSGEIKAEGKPSSPWKLQAGSGTIDLATGNAPMNLDASTGSGHISTNQALPMDTSSEHHNHLRGPLNGGGPDVRVQTGSGDIRVH